MLCLKFCLIKFSKLLSCLYINLKKCLIYLGFVHEYKSSIIGKLSKGFRQRVGISQAIIQDPQILILDEPTLGLGWDQRVILRSFLRECMTKMHFVIVSHDQIFIGSICDKIIDLDTNTIKNTQVGTEEKTKP